MSGLYGFNTQLNDSELVLLNVPWEVTTSYGSGASLGPSAILKSSPQLDLYSYDSENLFHEHPPHLLEANPKIAKLNTELTPVAQDIIDTLDQGSHLTDQQVNGLKSINEASQSVEAYIYDQTKDLLKNNKLLGLIGGDHSSPLGFIKALSDSFDKYDILHVDAHYDLRDSYQGFEQSHASIMYNVLRLENPPENLVQVGIRDYCFEENELAQKNPNIFPFRDKDLFDQKSQGRSWAQITDSILKNLKNPTYVSFDIDGLDPKYCPSTGTPVPGGLSFNEARSLIEALSNEKKIIGFDLCEVAPSPDKDNEWDGNVGARILFSLCVGMKKSQAKT